MVCVFFTTLININQYFTQISPNSMKKSKINTKENKKEKEKLTCRITPSNLTLA